MSGAEHDVVDAFFGDGGGGDGDDVTAGYDNYVDDDAVPERRDEMALADEMVDRSNLEQPDQYAFERTLDLEAEAEGDGEFDPELYADDGPQVESWMPPVPEGTDPAEWAFASQVARDTLTSHLTGEALQQSQRPTAESQLSNMLSASTAQALHQLAAVEQSRAEREAWNDQRAQEQQAQQQAQGYMAAHEIALQAMEHSDVRNADPHGVVEAANSLMIEWGCGDPETLAGLSDWQRQQVATAAIDAAAEMQRTVTITNQALRKV